MEEVVLLNLWSLSIGWEATILLRMAKEHLARQQKIGKSKVTLVRFHCPSCPSGSSVSTEQRLSDFSEVTLYDIR